MYTHQDDISEDIENCEICELAIENQQADYVPPTPQQAETNLLDYNTPKHATIYTSSHASSFLHFRLYGRPPPALV